MRTMCWTHSLNAGHNVSTIEWTLNGKCGMPCSVLPVIFAGNVSNAWVDLSQQQRPKIPFLYSNRNLPKFHQTVPEQKFHDHSPFVLSYHLNFIFGFVADMEETSRKSRNEKKPS